MGTCHISMRVACTQVSMHETISQDFEAIWELPRTCSVFLIPLISLSFQSMKESNKQQN